jgi:hypothetical protein
LWTTGSDAGLFSHTHFSMLRPGCQGPELHHLCSCFAWVDASAKILTVCFFQRILRRSSQSRFGVSAEGCGVGWSA